MNNHKWWQTAVFYQIYPRSFADGNGDGIGDIPGIITKLDYLQELGIDAIWLSPHFPSPQFDCGYDVADYVNVEPEYGTLADFREMLAAAHARGIRVILDLVLNHTSHLHAWFQESQKGRDSAKRDWYIWRDGVDGGPPNNWRSVFGGPAWEFDAASGQYYYHFFLKEQPDLNWRNPAVRAAMWDAVRFWLDMGVDGFRLDAINAIFEDPALTPHTSTADEMELLRRYWDTISQEEAVRLDAEGELLFRHQHSQPQVHDLMQELRQVIDAYDDRVLVGEADEIAFYGDGSNELHMIFNFSLMRSERLTPAWIRANQQERLAALPPGAWPCNTLNNHDSPRLFSRYTAGEQAAALARVHLALMLALKGTPFLYNGEEIGMIDYHLHDPAQFRDLVGVWIYRTLRETLGWPAEEATARASQMGRDKCRTPNQWAHTANGGFCPADVTPWLPVHPNWAAGVNVADQEADPDSLLHFYRRLLHARRGAPALQMGEQELLHEEADDYLALLRADAVSGQTCLVVLNFSQRGHTLCFDLPFASARPLFSSHARRPGPDAPHALEIAPFEVYIGELIRY
ncbi:MAG: alpha-glucosidase [Caldilineales bacterium]|nr:alpha-glucosidase [Caldilineales bacterium]